MTPAERTANPLTPMSAGKARKWVALVLGAAVLASGCATVTPPPGRGAPLGFAPRAASVPEPPGEVRGESQLADRAPGAPARLHRRREERQLGTQVAMVSPAEMAVRAVASGAVRVDAFEELLGLAGLDNINDLPPRGAPLTPQEAARVLSVLPRKPVTLGAFPPRMAVGHLLREVLEGGEVSREELLRRVERFDTVAVLRPDGYLAWTRNGRTQQKVGQVQWKDEALRAGPFELGRFYTGNGWVFRRADALLRPVMEGPPLAEVYDDADYISRTLDGAEEAYVELYHAMGQLLSRPTDSLAALRHVPGGVAALIASSPEYLERFRYMTRGEQVKAVSKLTTSLIVTFGAAGGTTRTLTGALAGAEATVPVLSLSAEGLLVMERVVVPVGRMGTVLSGGPGAAIILQRAGEAGSKVAPPERVLNEIREFSGKRFQIGSETFLLDKKGLQHILERHHPRYWNGTERRTQTFFESKMRIDDVIHAIESVLQQNREQLRSRGTLGMYQITGTVNGVEYVLGLNQGRIGQFYPL
jgi:hypothetical protein